MTVDEARAWLREQDPKKGAVCPCCDRLAQEYKRSLYGAPVSKLIALYKIGGAEDYKRVALLRTPGGDFAKLRHWGLIESPPEGKRPDGSRRTGLWRLTDAGVEFIFGRTTCPGYARLYLGEFLGLMGEPRTIEQALGEKFNYNDLMSR